jgi:hypothetical protein
MRLSMYVRARVRVCYIEQSQLSDWLAAKYLLSASMETTAAVRALLSEFMSDICAHISRI